MCVDAMPLTTPNHAPHRAIVQFSPTTSGCPLGSFPWDERIVACWKTRDAVAGCSASPGVRVHRGLLVRRAVARPDGWFPGTRAGDRSLFSRGGPPPKVQEKPPGSPPLGRLLEIRVRRDEPCEAQAPDRSEGTGLLAADEVPHRPGDLQVLFEHEVAGQEDEIPELAREVLSDTAVRFPARRPLPMPARFALALERCLPLKHANTCAKNRF